MKSLYTQIEINAPAGTVWKILTDFQSYSDWNPFIRSFDEIPEAGRQFSVTIQPSGKKPMTFKPVCLALIPEKESRWLGRLFITGLFAGEHIFELNKLDETRTQFIQRENFGGLLVPLLWKQLNTATRAGFEQMNQELKKGPNLRQPHEKPIHHNSLIIRNRHLLPIRQRTRTRCRH